MGFLKFSHGEWDFENPKNPRKSHGGKSQVGNPNCSLILQSVRVPVKTGFFPLPWQKLEGVLLSSQLIVHCLLLSGVW